MCIMPKVKKCEKTFALNVDIFKSRTNQKKSFANNKMYVIII